MQKEDEVARKRVSISKTLAMDTKKEETFRADLFERVGKVAGVTFVHVI